MWVELLIGPRAGEVVDMPQTAAESELQFGTARLAKAPVMQTEEQGEDSDNVSVPAPLSNEADDSTGDRANNISAPDSPLPTAKQLRGRKSR